MNPRNLSASELSSTPHLDELAPYIPDIEDRNFHVVGADPRNLFVSEPFGILPFDEPALSTQDIENIDSHPNCVDPRYLTVSAPVSTSHLDDSDPDSDAQDTEVRSFDSNAADPSNLFFSELARIPLSDGQGPTVLDIEDTNSRLYGVDTYNPSVPDLVNTSHLDEQDLDVQGNSHLDGENTQILSFCKPSNTSHRDEADFDAQDVECTIAKLHKASPPRMLRSSPADSRFSEAEEVTNVTSASVQTSATYRCDRNRLDGNLCHRVFTGSGSLLSHQITPAHTEPALCPFCPSRRLWPALLLFAHVKENHRDRLWTNFRCRICGSMRTASLRGLKVHVGRHHRLLSIKARYDATRGF